MKLENKVDMQLFKFLLELRQYKNDWLPEEVCFEIEALLNVCTVRENARQFQNKHISLVNLVVLLLF